MDSEPVDRCGCSKRAGSKLGEVFFCFCFCFFFCERVKLKVRFSEHWFYLLIRSKPLKMYLRHACVQSRFICHLYLPFAVNGDHLLTV